MSPIDNARPRPLKRYCTRGHDTWDVGRSPASHNCRQCQKENVRNFRKVQDRTPKKEYLTELRQLRQKRGHTLQQIAWESGLDRSTVHKIERLHQKASHEQRVKLFQAFNILRNRELEAKEAQMDKQRRHVWAGLT